LKGGWGDLILWVIWHYVKNNFKGDAGHHLLENSQVSFCIYSTAKASDVSRWVSEIRDPVAETMLEIRDGLQKINPEAAEEFIRIYLSATGDDEE
jgi:hypothetical protein